MLTYKSKKEIIKELNWEILDLKDSKERYIRRLEAERAEVLKLCAERNDLLVKLAVYTAKDKGGAKK